MNATKNSPSANIVRTALAEIRSRNDMSFRDQAKQLDVPLSTLSSFHYGYRPISEELMRAIKRAYPHLIPVLTRLSLEWLDEEAGTVPGTRR